MNKFQAVVCAALLFLTALDATARTRVLSSTEVKKQPAYTETVRVVCVDGYKFVYVVADVYEGGAVGITQVFEEKDGQTVPARCD